MQQPEDEAVELSADNNEGSLWDINRYNVSLDQQKYFLSEQKNDHKFDPLPDPAQYSTKSVYQQSVYDWKHKVKERKIIPPLPISFTISRISEKMEEFTPPHSKIPRPIGGTNKLWITRKIINGEEINDTMNLPVEIKTKPAPVSNFIDCQNLKSNCVVSYPPQPNMFDSYESYENSYSTWYETSKNQQNYSNFQKFLKNGPNIVENPKKYTPPKTTPQIQNVIDERLQHATCTCFPLIKSILNATAADLEPNYAPKKFDEMFLRSSQQDFLYQQEITPESLIEEYSNYGTDFISFNRMREEQVIAKFYNCIPYKPSVNYEQKHYLESATLVYTLSNLSLNFPDLDGFYLLKSINAQIFLEKLSFILRLTQNSYAFIMSGYVISKYKSCKTTFYGENVFYVIRNQTFDPVITHAINVLAQYNVIQIFYEHFKTSFENSKKIIEMMKEFYKGYDIQVVGLFQMFKENIKQFILGEITIEKVPFFVAFFNVILACETEFSFNFLVEIPDLFKIFNKIAELSDPDFMKILNPFAKIEKNLVLLARIFEKDLQTGTFGRIQKFAPGVTHLISYIFSLTPNLIPELDLDFIPIIIRTMLDHPSFTNYFAIRNIAMYCEGRFKTAGNSYNKIISTILCYLMYSMERPDVNNCLIESFTRLIKIDGSNDFIEKNSRWLVNLVKLQNCDCPDLQLRVWRSFSAAVNYHSKVILKLLKCDEQLSNELTQSIKNMSSYGTVEILRMVLTLVEKCRTKKKFASRELVIRVPDEVLDICKALYSLGFHPDTLIANIQKTPNLKMAHYFRKVVSKYKKALRDCPQLQYTFHPKS